MCGDQFVVHVPRMRRRVANPAQPVDLGEPAHQPPEAPGAPVRSFAMIGVHVLPEQRDIAYPPRDEARERKSVASGKRVYVRVVLGGRPIIKQNTMQL